jgi:tRNA/tmRNA/rRNA uracil-C5-methylase (TrmA/RlmC/RlmD family)
MESTSPFTCELPHMRETIRKDQFNQHYLQSYLKRANIHGPYNSPKRQHYRNKLNVVFGRDAETNEVMVGVYREKGNRVLRPIHEKILASNLTIQISQYIGDWVSKYSQYDVYNFETNSGLWRNFTIRENHYRQVMIIFHVHQHSDLSRWLVMELPLLIQHLYLKARELESDITQYSTSDLVDVNSNTGDKPLDKLLRETYSSSGSDSETSGSGSGSGSENESLKMEIPFELISVYYQVSNTTREMTRNDEFQYVWGDHYLLETMNFRDTMKSFAISPGAFFQINYYTAKKIYHTLAHWILNHPEYRHSGMNTESYLWDLCCGTGIISIYLGDLFDHCIGIDNNSYGIEDANRNVVLNDYNSAKYQYICGRVEDVFSDIYRTTKETTVDADASAETVKEKKTWIVVNPPRRGLYPIVLDTIDRMTREMNVPAIYYISCSVETLKRDLDCFMAKNDQYLVYQYITINQFPETEHSEVMIELRKKE